MRDGRMPPFKRLFLATVLLLLVVAVPTSAAAFDYTNVRNVSQPAFATEKTSSGCPPSDGRQLYIEVTRPKGDGQYPVILEASPYHGTLADREGTRILPDPRDAKGKSIGLTGYFAPRGYAVVMMDLHRLDVHYWAGTAGNQVALNLTFFDSDGTPGS